MTHEQVECFRQWLRDHHYVYAKGFWSAPHTTVTYFITGRAYVLKLTNHHKELQTVTNLTQEDIERQFYKEKLWHTTRSTSG